MFTSISATSTTANADAAIPEHATGSLNATTKRSTGYAAAVASKRCPVRFTFANNGDCPAGQG